MYGDELPQDADIVHYLSPTRVDNGIALWQAFLARKGGKSHSGHWLAKFQGNIDDKLRQVIEVANGRYEVKPSGWYAEIRVGDLLGCDENIKVLHSPIEATEDYLPDPSHCDIEGLPESGSCQDQAICERIVKNSIKHVHPVKA